MSDKDLIYALEEAYNASLGKGGVTLSTTFMEHLLEIVKEQQKVIEKYHKADSFLEAHGWKWE